MLRAVTCYRRGCISLHLLRRRFWTIESLRVGQVYRHYTTEGSYKLYNLSLVGGRDDEERSKIRVVRRLERPNE